MFHILIFNTSPNLSNGMKTQETRAKSNVIRL